MPMYKCLCIPRDYVCPPPVCASGVSGTEDPTGILELNLLNVQMGMLGVYQGCGINFYTPSLAHNVVFGPSGAYQIQVFNKHQGYWTLLMFSGVLYQTTAALNSYGPFLALDQIPIFWNNVILPPLAAPYLDPIDPT